MFRAILDEHKKQVASLKKDRDQAQKAASAAAEELVSSLVDAVDNGASQSFGMQRQIGKEVKDIRALITRVDKQMGRWAGSVERVDRSFKEFGDIENFLEVVDKEIRALTVTLGKLRAPAACDRDPDGVPLDDFQAREPRQ